MVEHTKGCHYHPYNQQDNFPLMVLQQQGMVEESYLMSSSTRKVDTVKSYSLKDMSTS